MSMADRILHFYQHIDASQLNLPAGIHLINTYRESPGAMEIASKFYHKYYNDEHKRLLILGINPGRFGAAVTGVPFTDPKRLESVLQIPFSGKVTHEPSSVFIYEMIAAYGGAEAFYNRFYINSIFPLALTTTGDKGKEKNFNYYDRPDLINLLRGSIINNINQQRGMGVHQEVCLCFGTGKNESFLRKLNDEYRFFGKIIALEHPRFIVQYKSRQRQYYIDKYLAAFNQAEALLK